MDKIIESNKIDKTKIILIIMMTILILIIIGLLFYINLMKDTSKEITAVVKSYKNGYITVEETDTNDRYILQTTESYSPGDIISLTIDNIDNNKTPKTATIKNTKLLSEAISFSVTDNKDDDKITENNTENSQENSDTKTSVTNEKKYTEEDIMNYFNNLNNEANTSKSFTSSLKSGFITIVDFLFYGKEIKGYTFNELTTSGKLKVLKVALTIDNKLNEKFPNYKDTLSDKYQNIKSKVVSKYLDITVDACNKDQDTCAVAKEGLTDLKNNFSVTWTFIKDISGVGVSKLKSWYSVWKNA